MGEKLFRATLSILAVLGLVSATTSPAIAAADSSKSIAWTDSERDNTSIFYDEFKNLKINVSQTENLTSQGITVSWEGLNSTEPGQFIGNYIQIMQCWGNDTNAQPENCQFGGSSSALTNLMGSMTYNRDLAEGEDPLLDYADDSPYRIPPPRNQPFLKSFRVPFTPVQGTKTFNYQQYFTADSSNELAASPVGQDGTGQAVFEVQTAFDAPHLGCGVVQEDGNPADCWLVVVPRGMQTANGAVANIDNRLSGSPLSPTNWAQRIQVRLGFAPLAVNCPLGNAERRLVGSETAAAAVTSWQPTLCKGSATYGFSMIGDGEARRQIISGVEGSSGLAIINKPFDTELLANNKILYAPVAQSSIVVAFNIERNLRSDAKNFEKNGTLLDNLTLNPRLLAKLLTQSYRNDVPNGNAQDYLAANPRSLSKDPEFIALNPEFEGFSPQAEPGGLLVALGNSDAAAAVWAWIQNDAAAVAFLKGEPDEFGMVVNKYYQSLDLATDTAIESYPKADLTTYKATNIEGETGFGSLDMRPYMNDMLDAALATRRADPKSKTVWDVAKTPPSYTSSGPQTVGKRFMLAITDQPSAVRYGLGIAKLQSGTGEAIAPTVESINATVAAMPTDKTSGVNVLMADAVPANGYPLAAVSYAAINPCTQDAESLKDYANFLTYAVGDGQISGDAQGELPRGYVPLSNDQKAETAKVAAALTSKDIKDGCPVATAEEIPAESTPIDSGEIPTYEFPAEYLPDTSTGTTSTVFVPNVFVTVLQSPGAANAIILTAAILGIPGLLIGRILLSMIKRRRQRFSLLA